MLLMTYEYHLLLNETKRNYTCRKMDAIFKITLLSMAGVLPLDSRDPQGVKVQ